VVAPVAAVVVPVVVANPVVAVAIVVANRANPAPNRSKVASLGIYC
jgi:hypothetical protein